MAADCLGMDNPSVFLTDETNLINSAVVIRFRGL